MLRSVCGARSKKAVFFARFSLPDEGSHMLARNIVFSPFLFHFKSLKNIEFTNKVTISHVTVTCNGTKKVNVALTSSRRADPKNCNMVSCLRGKRAHSDL